MPGIILAALVLAILMVSGGITYSIVNVGDSFETIVEPMTESAGGAISYTGYGVAIAIVVIAIIWILGKNRRNPRC
ncbi:MAG: hypothetical protein A2020_05855 [Lentisphaerae bacterium GWF2_45_14]|nr:MAG: hypothetical protein A2020_05855 [Lentisphaerae bacterium GWF2_45_14]